MAEHVRVMLSEEAVDKRIQQIGEQISKDYEGKQVHDGFYLRFYYRRSLRPDKYPVKLPSGVNTVRK